MLTPETVNSSFMRGRTEPRLDRLVDVLRAQLADFPRTGSRRQLQPNHIGDDLGKVGQSRVYRCHTDREDTF